MKHTLSFFLAALLVMSLSGCTVDEGAKADLYAMDTIMNMTAYGAGASQALSEAEEEINRLENLLSRTLEESEISALNRANGAPVTVDAEVSSLIGASVDYSAATNGAFDITVAPVVSAWGFTTDTYRVPSAQELAEVLKRVDYTQIQVTGDTVSLGTGQSIDLGGIAKGYASDQVAGVFQRNGVTSGMAALGGNVYVCGQKPGGSDWRVAVQDPQDSGDYVGILSLSDAFAVTSGGYQRYFEEGGQRYHHIIDPATGYPAQSGLLSATIVAPANSREGSAGGSGTMCDAFSTAVFIMGADRATAFWRGGAYAFDMVLVTNDNRILITDGIADHFTQTEGSGYDLEIIH